MRPWIREPFRRLAWPLGWALLTAAPYAAARLAAPEGSRYLWMLPPYVEDSQAYLAWARQAYQGALLFKLKLTSAPHAPFLFQPFFLAVGRVAAWGGWEPGVVQLAFKSLGVALFWIAFRRLAERLGFAGTSLWAATLLAGFGAGLGGTALYLLGPAVMAAHKPVDVWLIDASVAWALTWNALFPYSLTLIVLFVEAVDRASSGQAAWGWGGGLVLALLLLVHPYAAPLLALVAAAAMASRRRLGASWRLALPAAPAAAYVAWLSWAHPLLARHGALGRMETPSWPAVLLGTAPSLALAAWGAIGGGRDFVRRHALLIAWAAGALLLCRLPVWFQRKLLFGVQVPLSLLAGAAVAEIAARDGGERGTAAGLVAIALALSLPSWAYVGYNTVLSLSLREDGRYYVSGTKREALEVLARAGSPDEVVFSRVESGGLVAMTTGKTSAWGHWAQSVDQEETERWLDGLLAPGDPAERSRRLWDRADYVFADGRLKEEIDAGRLRWIKASARRLHSGPDADVYARPAPRPRSAPGRARTSPASS